MSKKSYSENKTLDERWKMRGIRNWGSDGKTGFVKIAQIETRHNMIWVRQYQGSTLANWASKAQERPTLIFWKARFHPEAKWLLGKDKSPSAINSTHSFSRTQIIARQAHIFTCKKCVTNNWKAKFFHQNFHGQRIYNCMEKFDCGCYGR